MDGHGTNNSLSIFLGFINQLITRGPTLYGLGWQENRSCCGSMTFVPTKPGRKMYSPKSTDDSVPTMQYLGGGFNKTQGHNI